MEEELEEGERERGRAGEGESGEGRGRHPESLIRLGPIIVIDDIEHERYPAREAGGTELKRRDVIGSESRCLSDEVRTK